MRPLSRMKSAVLAVLFGLVTGCGNPFGGDDETRIRLLNASTFELTNVTFSSGRSQLEFARIGPGEATEYREVSEAYRYGYFDALVDGQRRTITPIDYVGEDEPQPDWEAAAKHMADRFPHLSKRNDHIWQRLVHNTYKLGPDGRYTDETRASFVGMAPISDPKVVVAVVIDNPAHEFRTGGLSAAPVFAQVMEQALHRLAVTPDHGG